MNIYVGNLNYRVREDDLKQVMDNPDNDLIAQLYI